MVFHQLRDDFPALQQDGFDDETGRQRDIWIGIFYWHGSFLSRAAMTVSIAACGPINAPSCS